MCVYIVYMYVCMCVCMCVCAVSVCFLMYFKGFDPFVSEWGNTDC